MPLIMKPLSNPVDIFWANMGGGRGFFLLRRLIINIIGLLILVFLSTPAVSSLLYLLDIFQVNVDSNERN